jgi:hypothetical protein
MKMKMSNHPGGTLTLVLATTLCAFTPGLAAQSNDNAQQQEQPQQSQQQSKTFTGKVVKLQNGQYALVTGQTPEGKLVGHFLDDTDKAKGFENKQVTVTGTFDQASNTIHVTDIQSA